MPNKSYTACPREILLIAKTDTSINKQLFYNINEIQTGMYYYKYNLSIEVNIGQL